MTSSSVFMFLSLGVLYFLFFVFLKTFLVQVYLVFSNRKMRMAIKKQTQLNHQKRLEMIKNGQMHDWIVIPEPTPDGLVDRRVCKKTGWCPEKNGYFTKDYVKKEIKKKELAEEYKMYRDIEVGTLAVKYKVSREKMEEIVEDVFDIKKSFHLKKIENLLKDLQSGKI